MGCFQEGVMKDSVGGKDVTAHIFEYVTHFSNTMVSELTPIMLKVHFERYRN